MRDFTGAGDRLCGLRLELAEERAQTQAYGQRDSRSHPESRGRIEIPSLGRSMLQMFRKDRPKANVLANPADRQRFLRTLMVELESDRLHAEPAARALLADELERVERRLAASAEAPRLLGQLKTLRRKLYGYQREGVCRFFEARRLLLADDMGLGKTTQAVAACHALSKAGVIQRGLLIVPASLKSQWIREWESMTDVPVQAVDGRPEERQRTYRSTRQGFLVIDYEQLLRDLEAVHHFRPEVVVLDEAQRIKNWATKSSVYVKTLSPEWRLVLTGTPMENRLDELASILDWVDDVALTPKWRLSPWHSLCDADGAEGRAGARNLDTLRARLAPNMVRRVRKDVIKQLPPRTDTRVPVEMTEQQRREHDELIVPIAQLVKRAQSRPLTQPEFLRLMQHLTTQRIVSNGLAQLRFDEIWPTLSRRQKGESRLEAAFSPKLLELRRLVHDLVLEQGRKVVVFSQWRKMLRLAEWAVQDVLAAQHRRALFFTGAESQLQRTRSIVDFHDDDDASVMFLTDAGGVGLNLQRAASACINLEVPWNPAVLEQRIGRIYRIGQDQPIDVYNLVNEYGIEARIAQLVASKKALFCGLFDGTTNEIRFDSNTGFLADVERIVDPIEIPEFVAEESAEGPAEQSAEGPVDGLAEQSVEGLAEQSTEETTGTLLKSDQDDTPEASSAASDAALCSAAPATAISEAAGPPALALPVLPGVPIREGTEVTTAITGEVTTAITRSAVPTAEGAEPSADASPPAHDVISAPGQASTETVATIAGHLPEGAAATADSVRASPGSISTVTADHSKDAPSNVSSLLASLQMSRTHDGRVRLEAPAEAAQELIRLFEGIASMLRQSGG